MKTADLSKALFIFIIFTLIYVFNILSIGINKIKEDWPVYRCNPTIMPFASFFDQDTSANFTYCIQNMQTNYMGYLMQPLMYNLNVISGVGDKLTSSINDVRAFFNNIRGFITSIIQNVFGVFLNILIEFQRLTINIKDLFSKLVGILVTLMFTLDGSMKTMDSTWAGPPGQLMRALCFHPDTKLLLKDNSLVSMKDIPLNTVLKNGSIVYSVMNISNLDEKGNCIEALYKIKGGEGIKKEDILVSGSHLVYDPSEKGFVHVENLLEAEKTDIKCEAFSCLITSNHVIPIGKWIFHDWEDNNGSMSKSI
jgi:hypothetical protein